MTTRDTTQTRLPHRRRIGRAGAGTVLLGALGLGLAACGGSPAPAAPSAGAASSPIVHETVTILTGGMVKKKGWPLFVPPKLTVPANSTVRITVYNYDDGAEPTTAANYLSVTGTVGGTETADGTSLSKVTADQVSHTFTIPALGLNAPIPVAPAPGKRSVTTFTFKVGKAGTYTWQCMTPCGGAPNGMGGAMATVGYMKGTLTVT